ncbi:MAG TPA: 50S ribosomal protein L31 [Spirochaetota bacterium]|nr:50S ribosomal protein L31 [Spirochaetota bacterium]
MKTKTHPEYHKEMKVKCNCGNEFTVGGIAENLHVEVCSACHPFYTGKDRILDTEGRVEKFKKKFNLKK